MYEAHVHVHVNSTVWRLGWKFVKQFYELKKKNACEQEEDEEEEESEDYLNHQSLD